MRLHSFRFDTNYHTSMGSPQSYFPLLYTVTSWGQYARFECWPLLDEHCFNQDFPAVRPAQDGISQLQASSFSQMVCVGDDGLHHRRLVLSLDYLRSQPQLPFLVPSLALLCVAGRCMFTSSWLSARGLMRT